MLRYKCHLNGIIYLETEESYTSKCSFTDRESMSHKDDYKGKRMTRSLFKDSKGHIFNADIHGALNIIRKVFGYDVFKDDLISYVKKKIVKLSRYADLIKSSYIKEKSVNPVLGWNSIRDSSAVESERGIKWEIILQSFKSKDVYKSI